MTASDTEALVIRPKPTADEATPNANGVAAHNLIRLAGLTGEERWRAAADRLLDALAPAAASQPFMHCTLLNAIDYRLRGADIVIVGGTAAAPLARTALALPWLDRSVLRITSPEGLPASHPHHPKLAAAPPPAAFVCVHETCSRPLQDADALAAILAELRARGA
jgi:uncharacterized protein YyaL (SSP411 family)